MRSILPALLVLFLLVSGPVLAEDRSAGRMSRQRTVRVAPGASEPPSEVHIAGGFATLVSLDVPMASEGPRLEEAREHVRLIVVEDSSVLILPAGDLPEGERLLLSIPLEQGGSLCLALTSVRDEVDARMGLLLHAAESIDEEMGEVARLLNTTRAEPVDLLLSERRLLQSGDTYVRFRSILRLDHYLFVSFRLWEPGRSTDARKRLLLKAVLEDGSVVALSMVRLSSISRRQYTLVSFLPEGARHLEVTVRGEGTAEKSRSLPLVPTRSAP